MVFKEAARESLRNHFLITNYFKKASFIYMDYYKFVLINKKKTMVSEYVNTNQIYVIQRLIILTLSLSAFKVPSSSWIDNPIVRSSRNENCC